MRACLETVRFRNDLYNLIGLFTWMPAIARYPNAIKALIPGETDGSVVTKESFLSQPEYRVQRAIGKLDVFLAGSFVHNTLERSMLGFVWVN